MTTHADPGQKEVTVRLLNEGDSARLVLVEPWGEEFSVPPKGAIEVYFRGPLSGNPEIRSADTHETIYAWGDAIFEDAQVFEATPRGPSLVLDEPFGVVNQEVIRMLTPKHEALSAIYRNQIALSAAYHDAFTHLTDSQRQLIVGEVPLVRRDIEDTLASLGFIWSMVGRNPENTPVVLRHVDSNLVGRLNEVVRATYAHRLGEDLGTAFTRALIGFAGRVITDARLSDLWQGR